MLGCIRGGNKTETGLQYFCKDMREKRSMGGRLFGLGHWMDI